MESVGTAPRFPAPPAGAWLGLVDLHMAEDFVVCVNQWRRAAAAWLEANRTTSGISDQLTDMLLWTLEGGVAPAISLEPYRVGPFPGGASAPQLIPAILRWRGQIVDFLLDVWDVVGPPLFDLGETSIARQLFMPESLDAPAYCHLCLLPIATQNAADLERDHFERCLFQQQRG